MHSLQGNGLISFSDLEASIFNDHNNIISKQTNNFFWFKDESSDRIGRIKGIQQNNLKLTNYEFKEMLGSGAVGTVFALRPQGGGKAKAAKVVYGYRDLLQKEFEIYLMWPKNAVGLPLRPKAYFNEKEKTCEILIMHKYDSDIKDILSQLTPQEKIEAICQASQGLATLHNLGISHGDLHLGNILYEKQKKRFDLADFNLSVVMKDEATFNALVKIDLNDFKETVIKTILFKEKEDGKSEREYLLELGYSDQAVKHLIEYLENPDAAAEQIYKIFSFLRKISFEF